MLGEKALQRYRQGESCANCILSACEEKYGINLPEDCFKMCLGVKNGFGIGSVCSAVVTSVLFLGIYFNSDETKLKQARILFLSTIQEQLGDINCHKLKNNCSKAIKECGNALEFTIEVMNNKN